MFTHIWEWIVKYLADKAWAALPAFAAAFALGLVSVWYGYVWWHPIMVLTLMIAVFFLAIFAGYAWFHSERQRSLDARAFDPRTILTRLVQVHVYTLTRNDPFLSFDFGIHNASGQTVTITDIRGTMQIGGDHCGHPPVMDSAPMGRALVLNASGGDYLGFSLRQHVTRDVATELMETLRSEYGVMPFSFYNVTFVGTITRGNAVVPLPRCSVYNSCRAKGPMTFDGQERIMPLDMMLASGLFYNGEGNRLQQRNV